MRASHLTKNSVSFGFHRECGLGVGLLSFDRLTAFLDPSVKKLYLLHPLEYKTQKLHLKKWMDSFAVNAPSIDLKEYVQVNMEEERISMMLDDFLRTA